MSSGESEETVKDDALAAADEPDPEQPVAVKSSGQVRARQYLGA